MVSATSGTASAASVSKANADSASSLAASSTTAACPAQGTRFKTSSNPDVFLVGPSNVLYLFENSSEYFALYSSYSGIVTVSDAVSAACHAQSPADNGWPLALTLLAKATGNSKVYIYDAHFGGYRWIVSQSVFDRYGFSSSKIQSIPGFEGGGPDWT